MSYRYELNGTEVFPKGEWEISYERNEGQIFFRRIFSGELTFLGDDYDLILGLDCEIAAFDIYCKEELYWEGQFNYPYGFTFDDDSCAVTGTPETVDEYTCIMNNHETEYFTYPFVGGLGGAALRDCAGVLLVALPVLYKLIDNTADPSGDNYIGNLVNGVSGGNMNCELGIASSFFNRDNFANGDNYAAAYGGNNYITGAANRLEQVYLAHNSSIRSTMGGTVCGTPFNYTFKMFEDALRNSFNAYWFIDENGDFRVEHHYYFDPAFPNSDYIASPDLTTVMDRGGRSFAYRRNKYEYETGRLYDQEKWSWQHYEGIEGTVAHGADFVGTPVFYGAALGRKSDYVPGEFKEKDLATPYFWSDAQWAWDIATNPPNAAGANRPDTINCSTGFLMLDIDVGTSWVRCETGVLSAANQINGHLSTANLQDHYQQYDRIFTLGNMNSGTVLTFQTAQKHKLQEAIEFPWCCDGGFDPLNRVTTELGDGEVKAATQKDNSLEVELWHEFDCESLCIPEGAVMWDGVDDRIDIATPPLVDIQGTRTIEFQAYLYPDTALPIYSLFSFVGIANDFLVVFYAPQQNLLMVRVKSGAGTSRNWILLPEHYNKCVTVEITKTASNNTGCSIDGVPLANDGTNLNLVNPATSHIGYHPPGPPGSPYLKLMAAWDVKVFDPALVHHWAGHPNGNLNVAWLDQVGPNNGTVVGSPATY